MARKLVGMFYRQQKGRRLAHTAHALNKRLNQSGGFSLSVSFETAARTLCSGCIQPTVKIKDFDRNGDDSSHCRTCVCAAIFNIT